MCFGTKEAPFSPVGIAQSSRKGEEEKRGGGRGKREWKEGVLFAQLHPDHPAAPSVPVTVGWGSKGVRCGTLSYSSHRSRVPTRSAPGPTHLPNYQWVDPGRVRALCSPRHYRGPDNTPHSERPSKANGRTVSRGRHKKPKEKRERKGARRDLQLGVTATVCHETPAPVQLC